jgi:hypothetical protein
MLKSAQQHIHAEREFRRSKVARVIVQFYGTLIDTRGAGGLTF